MMAAFIGNFNNRHTRFCPPMRLRGVLQARVARDFILAMKLRSSFCVDFPQKAQSACLQPVGLNEKSADFLPSEML